MKKYKYQLHTHTTPCSACASMTPQELVESIVFSGYNGCVLTNHFLHGNTGINRNLPWDEFVAEYANDYYQCLKTAQHYDIDIIFGVEEHLGGGLEVLCYGITPKFLLDNPQLAECSASIWYKTLNSFGALCIQAHPFRDRAYITNPQLLPIEFIDGVEVFNFCNANDENSKAEYVAKEHPEWILTSGADAHSASLVCNAGIETEKRIHNEKDLVSVLKGGHYNILK